MIQAVGTYETVCAFVILHEEVELAVVVVIDPETFPPAISICFDSRDIADVGKRSIAVTVKEQIAFDHPPTLPLGTFGNVEIELAVVVVIPERKPVPVCAVVVIELAQITKAAGAANVDECAVGLAEINEWPMRV